MEQDIAGLLTAQELARALRLTVDTVWRYTRLGRIPSIRLSPRDYRYRLPEVLAALERISTATIERIGNIRLKRADITKLQIFIGALTHGRR